LIRSMLVRSFEIYGGAGFGYRGRVLVRGLEVSLYEKKVGVGNAG
jgi:hypothetical protein